MNHFCISDNITVRKAQSVTKFTDKHSVCYFGLFDSRLIPNRHIFPTNSPQPRP